MSFYNYVNTLAKKIRSNDVRKATTMLGANEQRSDVARLLAQIRTEYEAAQRGLSGLAQGTSQHDFITARMENMGELHTQLHALVGDTAIAMIADQLTPDVAQSTYPVSYIQTP